MTDSVTISPLSNPGFRAQVNAKLKDRRRAGLARLTGVIFLCAAATLLWIFIQNPMGTLPYYPQAWHGGPLILGTAFFAIYGTFLIVARRFSLAAFIVGGLASAILATAIHAYVYSLKEVVNESSSVNVPRDKTKEFIQQSRALLTPERLNKLTTDLYKDGYLKSFDFDSVTVTYGATANSFNQVCVTIQFGYCQFAHPRPTGARAILVSYADMVNGWLAARLEKEMLGERGGQVASLRLLILQEMECGKVFDPWPSEERRSSWAMTHPHEIRKALKWLCDHESDPEFKTVLEQRLQDYDKWLKEEFNDKRPEPSTK